MKGMHVQMLQLQQFLKASTNENRKLQDIETYMLVFQKTVFETLKVISLLFNDIYDKALTEKIREEYTNLIKEMK